MIGPIFYIISMAVTLFCMIVFREKMVGLGLTFLKNKEDFGFTCFIATAVWPLVVPIGLIIMLANYVRKQLYGN